MSVQPEEEPEEPLQLEGCCALIIYEYDVVTSQTHSDEKAFLRALREDLEQNDLKVQLREVKRSTDSVSKVLEKLQQDLKYKRVILAFPDEKFCEGQLVETFNAIMRRSEQSFVTVIIHTKTLVKLPPELTELQLRYIPVDTHMQDMASIVDDLKPFLQEEPKTVNWAFMNSGTGLAWSYYFGYLVYILPDFKENILTSTWKKNNPEIPENRISSKMFIVFAANCREPKIMNSERIIFNINKHPIDRAGLRRNYDFDIREVKSKDGKESYYGVVYFFNVVQALSEMRDDPNKDFVNFDEGDMKVQGRYCFEKLKLFMKYTYNEKIKIDQSKFGFIEFDTEAENADENDLADDLFNRMKETCSPEMKNPDEESGPTDTNQIGVLCDPINGEDIKEYVAKLPNVKQLGECPLIDTREEFGFRLIEDSKRIFMILTDDFVKSPTFEKWFYNILDKGYEKKNRRFLVCLNCLSQNANNPKVLELQLLFSCVSYKDKEWAAKVTTELEGDDQTITYDLQFNNIGTGLAMSWYYRYLKIRIPKVRDVIDQCPALKTKFENERMSHKVFILHPHSCHCPGKVSDVDSQIKLVDDKEINLPHIMKATRDYTPKVYCLTDKDGKEYYAFVEFNTQADTMYRMMQEGFLTNENILQAEWNRLLNKLYTLITHEKEPMDIKNRVVFIQYDDKNMKEGDLSELLYHHVQYEITREQKALPELIENGATIESKDWEKKPAAPAPAPEPPAEAGANAEADVTATTPLVEQPNQEGHQNCPNYNKVLQQCFPCFFKRRNEPAEQAKK